jgi:hypothetical protein
MNTYDPTDGIVYVHLASGTAPDPTLPAEDDDCARLPAGYANDSPSTALRHLRAQQRQPAPTSPPEPSGRADTA